MDPYNVRLPFSYCFLTVRSNAYRAAARAVASSLLLVLLGGCERQEGIRHYRVPKEHVLNKENGPDPSELAKEDNTPYRMLAAIIPRGTQSWFFRLLGPAEAVANETARFRDLVKSVRFAGEETPPEWKLPQGWQQKPASGMRFATIEIESAAGPLDLSVTVLPRNEPDIDAYTLSNVNRWRGQLGLTPLAQLGDNVERLEFDGGTASFFDLLGRKPQDNMSRAPFAGGAMSPASPPLRPGPTAAPPAGAAPAANRELTYDVPPGWTEAPAGGMRKAAFTVGAGGEVTAISLGGAGGELLPNINRWRQQVGLAAITQDELNQQLKKIDIGSRSADYVEITGATEAILGAIVPAGSETWFFKMKGATDLVSREKTNFESFVRSVRLAGAE